MPEPSEPAAEEIIRYQKDATTRIATITFDRPDCLNAPTISSDDALFGHPSFRYYGWGPRMWWWAQTMGVRKFQEMVFTGRAFTAAEMYDCNFLNSVVPRDELEAEVEKYALACASNRPTDTVFMQKVFFEIMKQFQGEYLGSMLSGVFESMGASVRPDVGDELMLDDAMKRGLGDAVKDNDDKFPAEWRLSKKARKKARADKDPKAKRKK